MKKQNVLFISDKSETGGAPKSMMDMISQLSKDYNIIVITPLVGKVYDFCSDNNIDVYVQNHDSFLIYEGTSKAKKVIRKVIVPFLKVRHKIINKIALFRIEKRINLKEIDLIHTNFHRNDIGGIIAKKYDIRHVVHLREFGNQDYKCIPIVSNYIKYMGDYTDRFIAISNAIKEYYSGIGLPDNKLTLIYNGVNVESIDKKEKYSLDDVLKIVFVGNLTESKGQLFALEAINMLNPETLKHIKVDFYGLSDVNYRKKIDSFILENNLVNIVKIIDYANNINKILKNYDVGLMCSKAEAFGRVTVEYMTAGLVTIVPDTGANPELISDGVNGFLYKNNDQKSLAKIIEKTYKDYNKMELVCNKARKNSIENFSYKKNANEVSKLYKQLI